MLRRTAIVAGNIKLLVDDSGKTDICFSDKPNAKNSQLAAFKAAEDFYIKNAESIKFSHYVMADHIGKNLELFLDKSQLSSKIKRRDLLEPNLSLLNAELLKSFQKSKVELTNYGIVSEASLRLTIYTILRDLFVKYGYKKDLPSLKDMENFIHFGRDINSQDAELLRQFFESITHSRLTEGRCGVKLSPKKRPYEPWINCEGIFLALWYRLARKLHKSNLLSTQSTEKLSITAFLGVDEDRCNKSVITRSLEYFFALFPNSGIDSIHCIFVQPGITKKESYNYTKVISKFSGKEALVYTPAKNFALTADSLESMSSLKNKSALKQISSARDLLNLSCNC